MISAPVVPYCSADGGDMGTLSGSQRKYLRGMAHSTKPAIHIGKEGLSESVLDAIENAIKARELIKVKIAADREERERLVPVLEEHLGAECVGTIGHMAILFREHPDPEKRTITLRRSK
jgi:RNA-binding protein